MWYRGGVGQWSWILHRVTGVGVLVFLCLHILDTFLIILGPEQYNHIIALYRVPLFRVMEVGLFASVLFHALNGVRIILIDFWVDLTRFQRRLFYAEVACFVVVMIPVAYLMLRPVFGW
ncbi:MAG: succinate dehydrogenase, cytochrome b556 subunit [Candidatus Omnitrophica bacterium]|nr:succinate dehydrogenase, cytochrome b556 subunit [Candidatus Omnitrophota bacterium]